MGIFIGPVNRIDSHTIECEISSSSASKKFFTGDSFKIRYDIDIQDVPESILVIPALTIVLPVAWVTGTNVRVDRVDSTFVKCLDSVRSGYDRMLELELDNSPSIVVNKLVDNSHQTNKTGMLFTGGVDSTVTYFRHRDKSPILIGIKNSKYSGSEWSEREELIRKFAAKRKLETCIAYSNLRSVLNSDLLNLYFEHKIGRYWFAGVQYGISYMGICAPITFKKNIGIIYQGSGYTQDPDYPTAQPYIVDSLSWGSSQCKIDAVEETRQDKINTIAANLEPGQALQINCCGCVNCCECEKCYRTILGFLAAGVDPQTVGFDINEKILEDIQADLKSGRITLSELQLTMWRDTQSELSHERFFLKNAKFVYWFKQADLSRFKSSSSKSGIMIAPIVRRLPYPIGYSLYYAYNKTRSHASSLKSSIQS